MTQRLTAHNFERARSFIRSNARPLDRRLFEYHFESGPASAVMDELARFQNADMGFGNALEPDFRLPLSSPMATTVAFLHLRELGATDADDLVKRVIRYFLDTYDEQGQTWHRTPREINDYPHAPWWRHPEEEGAEDPFGWGNPNCEIIGYLYEYQSLVPDDFLAKVTRLASDHIAALPDSVDVHAMECYLRLAETFPQPEGA